MTDAATRRVGFVVPEAIGGTGVQTKTAMNATRIVGVVGLVAGGEAAESFGEFALGFFVSERGLSGHLLVPFRASLAKLCAVWAEKLKLH